MAPALSRLSPKRRDMHLPIMEISTGFSLAEALALLIRTPATLSALLRGLPDIWVRRNEGRDTWSAFDIMGHLIVGERTDWIPRLRIILEKAKRGNLIPLTAWRSSKRVKASRSTSSWTISHACEGIIWLPCRR